ncbi:hypothetical protein [Stappia sp. WLB 29]|uniref:hypothetical protein n=1 Tax=Stappia sp. WLB 29 TaxID=2925220 RepID=UPI0020BD8BD6|nr:hypothetical protein [Stappia sp. WLB 29]
MTHRVGGRAGVRVPVSQMSGATPSDAIRCAPHVKRAHRAVFARFVLVLRAAVERSAVSAGVRA